MVFEILVVVVDLEVNLLSIVFDRSKIVLFVGIIGFREGVKETDFLKYCSLINCREVVNSSRDHNASALAGSSEAIIQFTNAGFVVNFV